MGRQSAWATGLLVAALILFLAGRQWLALAPLLGVALLTADMRRKRRERQRDPDD